MATIVTRPKTLRGIPLKRTGVIFATALAIVLLAVSAVPVFALDGTSNSTSTQDKWQNTAVVILNITQEPNSTAARLTVLQMSGNNSNEICYWLFVSDIENVT